MADIFLSYNEKDRDIVRQLAETLKAVGWSVWWDRRIPAGGTWRELLERELQSMRCMVVVWSSNSIRSEWVCEEATEGREAHLLVPVSIERVKPPAGFREIQAADLVGWDGTATFLGMKTLIEDIQQKIGSPASEPIAVPQVATKPFEPHLPTRKVLETDRRLPERWRPSIAMVIIAVIALVGAYAMYDRTRGERLAKLTASPNSMAEAVPASPSMGPVKPGEAQPVPASMTPVASPTPSALSTEASGPAVHADKQAAGPFPGATSVRARCADLRQRFSLGETLTTEATTYLQKECGK